MNQTNLIEYLRKQPGTFSRIRSDSIIKPQHIKCWLARSGIHYLILITRAEDHPDLHQLSQLLKQPVKIIETNIGPERLQALSALPPLPNLLQLKGIIDPEVLTLQQITFDSLDPDYAIKCSITDLKRLLKPAIKTARIVSESKEMISLGSRIIDSIRQGDSLPPMPDIAQRVMQLSHQPYAGANQLAALLERDPSLATLIIRYANSPLYAPLDPITDLNRAIMTLGFDFVTHLALGLSIGQSLQMPKQGALGALNFWKHALATATLTKVLIETIDFDKRPLSGTGYLAGLLHNIGQLYLGHRYPLIHKKLNQSYEKLPDMPLHDLENLQIGINHTDIGAALFEAWKMPVELTETVAHHHDPHYPGESLYPPLVYVATALLAREFSLGDGEAVEISELFFNELGLSQEKIEQACAVLQQELPYIEKISVKLAA